MFQKILVALDRSEMGKYVFEQGLALAKLTGARLMLLQVLSAEEEGSPYIPVMSGLNYVPAMQERTLELYKQQWKAFKKEGIELLQSYCAKANSAGVETEFTQNPGSPGSTICELARSWNADLIVMGRRGHSGVTELFLGSASNYVLHHTPCSVHIVRLPATAETPESPKDTTSTGTEQLITDH
jgi:nucleotide-binding universal stress UspA family protein